MTWSFESAPSQEGGLTGSTCRSRSEGRSERRRKSDLLMIAWGALSRSAPWAAIAGYQG